MKSTQHVTTLSNNVMAPGHFWLTTHIMLYTLAKRYTTWYVLTLVLIFQVQLFVLQYRRWGNKISNLGENDFFFHFLSLVGQILYWQNFACQFAKMSYLRNLITFMACNLVLKAMNVFMLSWTLHFFEIGESGANWHPPVSAHVAVANLWRWCFYVAHIPTRIPRIYGGQTRLGLKITTTNHFWITRVYFFNNSYFVFSS